MTLPKPGDVRPEDSEARETMERVALSILKGQWAFAVPNVALCDVLLALHEGGWSVRVTERRALDVSLAVWPKVLGVEVAP